MADIATLVRLTGEIMALLHNAMIDTIDGTRPADPPGFFGAPGCTCPDGVDQVDPHYYDCPYNTLPTKPTPPAPPEPEPLITYDIPGAPPTERVVAGMSRTWQRRATGMWRLVGSAYGEPLGAEDGSDDIRWADLLASYGPVVLVPLTADDELDALLYGPPGARWGNPDVSCPYAAMGPIGEKVLLKCALGLHHAGGHRDVQGRELVHTFVDQTDPTAGRITPQEAAEVPCTCGNPAVHQPGCVRYDRMVGHHNGGRFDDQG